MIYWRLGKMRKAKEKSTLKEKDLSPENIRMRISMMMPLDLIDTYKAEAEKLGIGYQTLMQIKLREAIGNPLEKRIEALEKKLKRA